MFDTFHESWKKGAEAQTEAFLASKETGKIWQKQMSWFSLGDIYCVWPKQCLPLPYALLSPGGTRPICLPKQNLPDIKIMSCRWESERESLIGSLTLSYFHYLDFCFLGEAYTLDFSSSCPNGPLSCFFWFPPEAKWSLCFDVLLLPDTEQLWKANQAATLALGESRALLCLTSRKTVHRLSTGGFALDSYPCLGKFRGPSLFFVAAATLMSFCSLAWRVLGVKAGSVHKVCKRKITATSMYTAGKSPNSFS